MPTARPARARAARAARRCGCRAADLAHRARNPSAAVAHGSRDRATRARDALAAPDEADPLAGARLDVHARRARARAPRARRARIALAVGRELRRLHDDGAVDVDELEPALARASRRPPRAARSSRRRASARRCRGSARRCRRARRRRAARRSRRGRARRRRSARRGPRSCGISTPPMISRRPVGEAVGVIADARPASRDLARRRSRADRLEPARAPLEHATARSTPSSLEQLERLLVARADVLRAVRVAGERHRHARFHAHLQERRRRVDLADGLAQPGGRDLDGDARLGDRFDRGLVVAAQVALRARAAVRGPQIFTRSGWARMSNRPLRAASATVSK